LEGVGGNEEFTKLEKYRFRIRAISATKIYEVHLLQRS